MTRVRLIIHYFKRGRSSRTALHATTPPPLRGPLKQCSSPVQMVESEVGHSSMTYLAQAAATAAALRQERERLEAAQRAAAQAAAELAAAREREAAEQAPVQERMREVAEHTMVPRGGLAAS